MKRLIRTALLGLVCSCAHLQSREELPVGELGFTIERLASREMGYEGDSSFGMDSCWIDHREHPDLLVSMPDALGKAGALLVLDGASGELKRSFSLPGVAVEQLGKRLQTVGDVDGDGAEDFVVFGEATWESGQRFEHAFGVSSATGRVLYEVEGLHRPKPWSGNLVTIEPFDFDEDGVFDFVVEPAGPAGRFQIRSGRDGSVLCAFDLGPVAKDTHLSAVHLSNVPGQGLIALVALVFEEQPAWRTVETLLRIDLDGTCHQFTFPRPLFGHALGFFDLGGKGACELLMERPRLSGERDENRSEASAARSAPMHNEQSNELVGVDVFSGQERLIASLPPWHDGDEIGRRDANGLGIAEIDGHHVVYMGSARGEWYGELAAFEVGRSQPLWIWPANQATSHIGSMITERAVKVNGEAVAAFGDAVFYAGVSVNVIVVRVRDGKVLWHLTPEDVFGELRARTE